MIFDETYTLSDGTKLPKLALGTWLMENGEAEQAVKEAIKIGYRHIDTAQAYGNEQGVGEGIRMSGIPREQIFVTSKVEAEYKNYKIAKDSIDKTLKKMNFEYIDMMLIHSPQPWEELNKSEYRYFSENQEVWRAMEEAVKSGKIRTIGVSNFLKVDIENIFKSCTIKPVVNQILVHITNTPFELINYCEEQGIHVEAYSPIAHGNALKNKKIAETAIKYNVSVAQLCIKYALQLGLTVLPKTSNPDHMRNNAQLDFSISEEDMEELKKLKN